MYSVSQKKSPLKGPDIFHFFHKRLRILIDFLHTYYTFLSTLDYKFLFNYPRLWQSYAILTVCANKNNDVFPWQFMAHRQQGSLQLGNAGCLHWLSSLIPLYQEEDIYFATKNIMTIYNMIQNERQASIKKAQSWQKLTMVVAHVSTLYWFTVTETWNNTLIHTQPARIPT